MIANIYDDPIRIVQIPKGRFKRRNGSIVECYHKYEDYHNEDGFREVIVPAYDSETHQLGKLIVVDDDITYEVDAIPEPTDEEIKQGKIDAGVFVNGFYFKDTTILNNFVTHKNESKKGGATEMGWPDQNNEWKIITIKEAQQTFLSASQEFELLYKS